MDIQIRKALPADLDVLMDIFEVARRFMQATGNPNQWINGYPGRELMEREVEAGHCFVCIDDRQEIIGTFCFILGEDPTYAYIEDGSWPDQEPYGVIHRLATNGKQKGMSEACLDWCFERWPNVRVDTHRDNKVMQHILTKYGFQRCGIIYVKNGTERIAYQMERLHGGVEESDRTEV